MDSRPENGREAAEEAISRLNDAGYTHIHEPALASRDWWGVIAFATTADYWRCFDVLEPLMRDGEYATTVRQLWVATNGLPPEQAERRLLNHGRAISREMWMTPPDAATLRNLPDQVAVFRGCQRGFEQGWSWSLNRDAARRFARGLIGEDAQPGVLVTGSVAKQDIIALFSGNWEEQEVIVPGHLVAVRQIG